MTITALSLAPFIILLLGFMKVSARADQVNHGMSSERVERAVSRRVSRDIGARR